MKERILELVRRRQRKFNSIVKALGQPPADVAAVLNEMCLGGELSVSSGVYRLPTHSSAPREIYVWRGKVACKLLGEVRQVRCKSTGQEMIEIVSVAVEGKEHCVGKRFRTVQLAKFALGHVSDGYHQHA